jgi:hypothetical protein
MPEPHVGDVALRFMAMYSQLQEVCDDVLRTHIRTVMPSLSATVLDKMSRLSDKERIQAVARMAEDFGMKEEFRLVPDVFYAEKRLRDSIGHSTLMGAYVEDEVSELFILHGDESRTLRTREMIEHYYRTLWVLEHVLTVGHASGFRTYDGTPFARISGALLPDAPPAPTPPRSELSDPVVLLEQIDEPEDKEP